MSSRIPILLYHLIDDSGSSTATDSPTFRAHLEHLHEHGWRSLSLIDFESYLVANEEIPDRHFLLCLENSHGSLESTALPIIEEFGFCGVAFIDVRKIRCDKEDATGLHEADSDYLSWQQVRKIQAKGVLEFQPCAHDYQQLGEWDASEMAEELLASLDLLSRELELPHHNFNHLAWPIESPPQRWLNVATDIGFDFQYNRMHTAYRQQSVWSQIPCLCFDGCPPRTFRRRFFLQTGPLSAPWHVAQGMARSVKQMCRRFLPRRATAGYMKAKREKETAFPSVLQ